MAHTPRNESEKATGIVAGKEVRDAVKGHKTAGPVKCQRRWGFSCPQLQTMAGRGISRTDKFYQRPAVTAPAPGGCHGQVLDLRHALAFPGHDAKPPGIGVMKDEQFPAFQIPVYHGLALIPDEQERQPGFLMTTDMYDIHIPSQLSVSPYGRAASPIRPCPVRRPSAIKKGGHPGGCLLSALSDRRYNFI